MLRDIAIFGKSGFNSDIDIVVEGDWSTLIPYLNSCDAKKNKFGGYRLTVGNWPIDIWQARETWAIKNGLVRYDDISSLNKTTILNWDAILMNWRTKIFTHDKNYFDNLAERSLNVVLADNPNPVGSVVRIFRHIWQKNATKIDLPTIKFLIDVTNKYSFAELHSAEKASYEQAVIRAYWHRFFRELKNHTDGEIRERVNDTKHKRNDLISKLLGQTTLC